MSASPGASCPPGLNQISASFREDIGGEFERLTTQTRRHDLIVVKGGSTKDGGLGSDTIGRLILGSGRPVLLAPTVPSGPMRIVVVAWKDRPEAARAVSAAMPILREGETDLRRHRSRRRRTSLGPGRRRQSPALARVKR